MPAAPPTGAKAPTLARRLSRPQTLWVISAGTVAIAGLALLAVLWNRTTPTPVGENAAPQAAQPRDFASSPNEPAPGVASKPSSAPSKTTGPPAGDARIATAAGSSGQPADREVREPQPPLAATQHRLQLLVPAYIYPVGGGRKEWLRLIEPHPR